MLGFLVPASDLFAGMRYILQERPPKLQAADHHACASTGLMISSLHYFPAVGAGANVLILGRFQNAEGFAAALAWSWRWRFGRVQASGLGVSLTAVALALDQNGLDVVQQAVQQG